MSTSKYEPLTLVYLLFLILLSYMSITNDLENHYHFVIIALGCIHYCLLNAGVWFYGLNIQTLQIKRVWKLAFPYTVFYFIFSAVVDARYGMNKDAGGIAIDIAVWIIGILLFFPAFRASYLLAYRNASANEVQPSPATVGAEPFQSA